MYDGLGSVVGEVDPSGNLTSSGTFDVYGAKRQGGTGAATTKQGFVGGLGHVTDSETGLVYMRARYYDPQTGRFVSQDPSGGGENWFIYANNNPTNNVDSSGKSWWDVNSLNGLNGQMYYGFALMLGADAIVIAWTFTRNGAYKDPLAVGFVCTMALASSFLFALALGKTPEEAAQDVAADVAVELVAGIIAGETGKGCLAGASAVAAPALLAAGTYSLELVGAL